VTDTKLDAAQTVQMKHNVSTDTEDMSCHIISNGEFDIFTEGNVCPMSA